MGMMKGLFLTVLALFVASCQMKNFLIETGSKGGGQPASQDGKDVDYFDPDPSDPCQGACAQRKWERIKKDQQRRRNHVQIWHPGFGTLNLHGCVHENMKLNKRN